jgi:hypothetical protein
VRKKQFDVELFSPAKRTRQAHSNNALRHIPRAWQKPQGKLIGTFLLKNYCTGLIRLRTCNGQTTAAAEETTGWNSLDEGDRSTKRLGVSRLDLPSSVGYRSFGLRRGD